MKKNLLWILSILLLSAACSSDRNDWKTLNLKGSVKYLTERKFEAEVSDGKAEKGHLIEIVQFKFDKNGHVTEELLFDRDGDTVRRIVSFYEKDLLVKNKLYKGGSSLDVTTKFSYDTQERVISVVVNDDEDITVMNEEYTYNDDNHIETKTTYNANHEVVKRIVTNLDKDNLPSEIRIYNEAGTLVNYRKESYDGQERLNDFIVFAADEQTAKIQVKLSYDKAGNLISKEAVNFIDNESFETETYKYEYDEKLNWIRQAQYIGDNISTISERTITYY